MRLIARLPEAQSLPLKFTERRHVLLAAPAHGLERSAQSGLI
jgi:hypothetical protein